MKIIKVKLKDRSYNIIAGNNIINRLGRYLTKLRVGRDAYIITNAKIKNRYGNILLTTLKRSNFSARFKIVPDTEKSKSIEMASLVIHDMARYNKKRKIFILALGGGVVGDLAGFIASVYKRGTSYIQIPTTLLAQIDSSIGGKTGVDLLEGKNLVGAFYQPRLVLSDVRFLRTLNQRQIRNGLAEAIKYGIIKDRNLFIYLEKRYKNILGLEPDALKYIVTRCSQIKAEIVGRDEREKKGLRTVLNFGHTIGHAIEAASKFKIYNHGEAIALGMLIASDISRSVNLIDDRTLNRMGNLIKAVGLPLKIKRLPLRSIIHAHYYDKKFIGAKNRFVLTCGIAKTRIVENIPLGIIRKAIAKRM